MLSEKKRSAGTIVIFSTAYLPFIGGAETAIKGITDILGDDLNFVMFTSRFRRDLPKIEKIGKINVFRIGFGSRFDKVLLPVLIPLKYFSVKKTFSKPILLWAMMVSYAGLGAYYIKILDKKTSLLLTLQEGDPEEHIRRARLGLIGFFWRRMLKAANGIQVISIFLKDLALKLGARTPIEIVPNGVDFGRFSNVSPDKILSLKQSFGIRPGEKIIITVSRLTKKNAVDIIVRALPYVKTPVRFLIVGEGEERKMIESQIVASDVKDKVIFIGSVLDELPVYLALADVFVRPSRSEGLGTAFLEAMAAGVPIIATPVGGIKDFLVDRENGLAVQVDNPQDLAQKIDLILNDGTLRQKLIRNGQQLVEEKYQWSNITSQMEAIFKKLLLSSS